MSITADPRLRPCGNWLVAGHYLPKRRRIMKRRDFIVSATSTAGILLIDQARAAIPCPPVFDGADSAMPCPAGDVEADWQARISGEGVVWYHDFRSEAEVDAFRWAGGVGNDPDDVGKPNTVRRITTDGITGACLEVHRPAGSSEGAVWWRPFSPLDTGSGKPVADPAASNTLAVEPWNATQRGSQTANWKLGNYGHSSYHSQYPGRFDGTEYYFQARVKMDPRRATQGDGGKLFYFTRTDKSLTSQEIVTESGETSNGVNYFSMYRSGSPPLESDSAGNANQPGSELGFCDWPDQVSSCWAWSGGWDTVLYRIVPGTNSFPDTIVQVWAAHAGETSYTQIWNQNDVKLPFDVIEGHSAVICSGYQNGLSFDTDVYHRYCQLIFSKNFIPCPQA